MLKLFDGVFVYVFYMFGEIVCIFEWIVCVVFVENCFCVCGVDVFDVDECIFVCGVDVDGCLG